MWVLKKNEAGLYNVMNDSNKHMLFPDYKKLEALQKHFKGWKMVEEKDNMYMVKNASDKPIFKSPKPLKDATMTIRLQKDIMEKIENEMEKELKKELDFAFERELKISDEMDALYRRQQEDFDIQRIRQGRLEKAEYQIQKEIERLEKERGGELTEEDAYYIDELREYAKKGKTLKKYLRR